MKNAAMAAMQTEHVVMPRCEEGLHYPHRVIDTRCSWTQDCDTDCQECVNHWRLSISPPPESYRTGLVQRPPRKLASEVGVGASKPRPSMPYHVWHKVRPSSLELVRRRSDVQRAACDSLITHYRDDKDQVVSCLVLRHTPEVNRYP